MEIRLKSKTVFGNTLLYPANDAARTMCKLTRHTTLTFSDLVILDDVAVIYINGQGLLVEHIINPDINDIDTLIESMESNYV